MEQRRRILSRAPEARPGAASAASVSCGGGAAARRRAREAGQREERRGCFLEGLLLPAVGARWRPVLVLGRAPIELAQLVKCSVWGTVIPGEVEGILRETASPRLRDWVAAARRV